MTDFDLVPQAPEGTEPPIAEPTLKVCSTCGEVKPIRSFNRIDKKRRKSTCNRCIRAERESEKFDMSPEEYLSFSDGPCVCCGNSAGQVLKIDDEPVSRFCSGCRSLFARRDSVSKVLLIAKIMEMFPFWLDLLKDNKLSLFSIE